VTSARVETFGGDAVDVFYLANPSGTPLDGDRRRRIEESLAAAASGAVHTAAAEGKADTPG
jgi:[protein-PII] uridylyltransferase